MTSNNNALDRRQFLITGSAALLTPAAPAAAASERSQQMPQKIRIGIIGAENSHTIAYGQMFNRDRKFPGCEVVGVLGETAEFARQAAEKGKFPGS